MNRKIECMMNLRNRGKSAKIWQFKWPKWNQTFYKYNQRVDISKLV